MKTLSTVGSPLPSLAFRTLTPTAHDALDDKLLAYPSSFISAGYSDVTHALQRILRDLPMVVIGAHQDEELRKGVLDTTELLMHKLSTLHEALSKTVTTLSDGKSTRSIRTLKEGLIAIVDRQFKIPVNLVKHDGFSLRWLDAKSGSEHVAGFVISGLIDKGVVGPANHGAKPKAVCEGCTFAKVLRDALSSLYAMCDIAEDALWKAGALEESAPIDSRWNEETTAKTRLMLSALNDLPLRCFPNEQGSMVSEYSLLDDAVVETRKWKLHEFQQCRFSYSISAEQGTSYKMPFWVHHGN